MRTKVNPNVFKKKIYIYIYTYNYYHPEKSLRTNMFNIEQY